MADTKKKEWNNSYKNNDNFIFYPHEDIIRFISKYIRKRTGLNEFNNIHSDSPKVLDFGCGIGRHIKLLNDFNIDGYGFDLSDRAISVAKNNFKRDGLNKLIDKVIVADITQLPYDDNDFNFMLSHGVLDSMPFDIAKKGISELHRTLKNDGLIYFDLIEVEDTSFDSSKGLDQIVTGNHENGTIQSYYNLERINELIAGNFSLVELYKIKKIDAMGSNSIISRYHVIARKIIN